MLFYLEREALLDLNGQAKPKTDHAEKIHTMMEIIRNKLRASKKYRYCSLE